MNTADNGMSSLFAKLISKDNSAPEDYYDEENLLMCGKCHTRKQLKVNLDFLGLGERIVGCLCKCATEKRDKEEIQSIETEKANKIKTLKEQGITDTMYLTARIENDDRKNAKISDAIIRYTNKWEEMFEKNMGILFYGDVGRGKTFFAGCIANRLLEQGTQVIMTNVSSLITAMSKDFEKEKASILHSISNVPLLVLDDLGVERDTQYISEKLQEIIDTRYRSKKPLIVTTNLSPNELRNPVDLKYKRMYDRLLEMCYPMLVDGDSRRNEQAQAKRKEFKHIIFE